MAVRNEERAFTLWSYIAAETESPEIQRAAEKMAHEELEHVSLLRRARRSAYHAERAVRPAQRALSVDALLALTAANEARLAMPLEELAGRSAGEGADQARKLAVETRGMAAAIAAMSSSADEMTAIDDEDVAALAERLVEAYLDISDRSRDEAVVSSVQILARQAIARLAWLRHFE